MAINLNLTTTSSLPSNPSFLSHKHSIKFNHPSSLINKIYAQSQGADADAGFSEDDSSLGSLSSSRAQLDLLEQFTSTTSSINSNETDGRSRKLSIRDQLAQLVGDRDDDFTIPLGAFVILPPLIILGIAILTGYVQLLP
ncbi:unnamed protein product [Vicia faba]|uniref:Uncharacterized protein n=1 Tax=Vicia faba TaxID=3906 RepID=A0AAV0YMZ1_VICFA|nr:unnamed protein product [Vicia faba]